MTAFEDVLLLLILWLFFSVMAGLAISHALAMRRQDHRSLTADDKFYGES